MRARPAGTDRTATRLQQTLMASRVAVTEIDLGSIQRLTDPAEEFAETFGELGQAQVVLAAGGISRAAGDSDSAICKFNIALELAGQHMSTSAGIHLYLHAALELAVTHRAREDYLRAEELLLAALANSIKGWPQLQDLALLYSELSVIASIRSNLDLAARYKDIAAGLLQIALEPTRSSL